MSEETSLFETFGHWVASLLALLGLAVSWGMQRQRMSDLERRVTETETEQKDIFIRLRGTEAAIGVITTKLDSIEAGQRAILEELKGLRSK